MTTIGEPKIWRTTVFYYDSATSKEEVLEETWNVKFFARCQIRHFIKRGLRLIAAGGDEKYIPPNQIRSCFLVKNRTSSR